MPNLEPEIPFSLSKSFRWSLSTAPIIASSPAFCSCVYWTTMERWPTEVPNLRKDLVVMPRLEYTSRNSQESSLKTDGIYR